MWLSRLENHNGEDGPRSWRETPVARHGPFLRCAHVRSATHEDEHVLHDHLLTLNVGQAHCILQTANTECNVTGPCRTDASKPAFLQRFRPALTIHSATHEKDFAEKLMSRL